MRDRNLQTAIGPWNGGESPGGGIRDAVILFAPHKIKPEPHSAGGIRESKPCFGGGIDQVVVETDRE